MSSWIVALAAGLASSSALLLALAKTLDAVRQLVRELSTLSHLRDAARQAATRDGELDRAPDR